MTEIINFWYTVTLQLWNLIISQWILSIFVLIILMNFVIDIYIKGKDK